MRIALIDTTPKARLYPLPLLKIGAWRKSLGDECVLFRDRLPKQSEFDAIWLTTCFTFDIPHALGIAIEAKRRAEHVMVGGVAATLLPEHFERHGLEVHQGLLPDAEAMPPDYTLLGKTPEYSITHTSRGCSRKCGFCMVRKLEPVFSARQKWVNDIHPATQQVLFYDNNWLAKGTAELMADIGTLHQLVKAGTITSIDFNQGLDCRLMTEKIADALRGLPIKPVRFAFDGMHEDGHYQRAVEMMVKRGFRNFMAYVLYNFNDTPEEFWYRLRESVRMTELLGVSVSSFPMRYQPIMEADKGRNYIGRKWDAMKRANFMRILSRQSMGGQVSCPGSASMTPLQEFGYWFGNTSAEFSRLLSYPRLTELMKKKKGNLRIARRSKSRKKKG